MRNMMAGGEMELLPSADMTGTDFIRKDRYWNADDLNEFLARDGRKIIVITGRLMRSI